MTQILQPSEIKDSPAHPRTASTANGQIALVTGGNRGLGFETCLQLVDHGFEVILTTRRAEDGDAAVAKIRSLRMDARITAMPLDLARFQSIRELAALLHAKVAKLDLVIHNAGYFEANGSGERHSTIDGHERHWAVNYLGPFLLTHLVFKLLKAAGRARVIFVGSMMHAGGPGRGPPAELNFQDLEFLHDYSAKEAYKRSKLACILAAREFHRRFALQGISFNAVSPKIVPETIATQLTGVQRWMMLHVVSRLPMARTTTAAAKNTVWVATDRSFETRGGLYLEDFREAQVSKVARDPEIARRLYELTAKLVLAPGEMPRPAIDSLAGRTHHNYIEVIENQGSGERVAFLRADQKQVVFDDYIPAGLSGPPTHWHPRQSETFEVLQGELRADIDGKCAVLRKGERVVIPPGVPHTFTNQSGAELVMRVSLSPGLDSDEMFRTLMSLHPKKGIQQLIHLSRAQSELQSIFFMKGPVWAQRLTFHVLGWLHRTLIGGDRPRAFQIESGESAGAEQ